MWPYCAMHCAVQYSMQLCKIPKDIILPCFVCSCLDWISTHKIWALWALQDYNCPEPGGGYCLCLPSKCWDSWVCGDEYRYLSLWNALIWFIPPQRHTPIDNRVMGFHKIKCIMDLTQKFIPGYHEIRIRYWKGGVGHLLYASLQRSSRGVQSSQVGWGWELILRPDMLSRMWLAWIVKNVPIRIARVSMKRRGGAYIVSVNN